jgi:hyaluronoglucosaminidase
VAEKGCRLTVTGVIEGFYGQPWSHEERLDLLAFCGREGFNTWVHAPKDDPYHRKRWREPYPDEELEQFGELVQAADARGVEFVWAVAPGLSIDAADSAELDALNAKREQLRSAGVRTFQLLWDDIEPDAVAAEAQAEITNRFASGEPLVVCPMGYAGNGRTPYRDAFAARLDQQVVVYWTGPEVVSTSIARADLDAAVDAFDHELLLWDNYPTNDFDVGRLFLGPLRGRDPLLAEGRLHGIVANAMVQAIPSKLALATVSDWARDPQAYDPYASFERALRNYGTEVLDSLRRLAAAQPASSAGDGDSPGDSPRHPALTLPEDLRELADALAPGVDAATARALLEPFV